MAAQEGGWTRCCIERMRLPDGCVAAAASAVVKRACELLQKSFYSAVTWPRSLFASVEAAGATADIHTSNCTPLASIYIARTRACQITLDSLDTHITVCPLLACQSTAVLENPGTVSRCVRLLRVNRYWGLKRQLLPKLYSIGFEPSAAPCALSGNTLGTLF